MANEIFRIAGQPHLLAFCQVVITPVLGGPNVGRPFTLKTRSAFEANGDTGALYLVGPDGAPLAVGAGTTEPKWSIELEHDETYQIMVHLAGGNGSGYKGVYFNITFTHAPPGRTKRTDVMERCLWLDDNTAGKAGDNTMRKIGGPGAAWKPNGAEPFNYAAVHGA